MVGINLSASELSAVFERIDTAHSGRISLVELANITSECPPFAWPPDAATFEHDLASHPRDLGSFVARDLTAKKCPR